MAGSHPGFQVGSRKVWQDGGIPPGISGGIPYEFGGILGKNGGIPPAISGGIPGKNGGIPTGISGGITCEFDGIPGRNGGIPPGISGGIPPGMFHNPRWDPTYHFYLGIAIEPNGSFFRDLLKLKIHTLSRLHICEVTLIPKDNTLGKKMFNRKILAWTRHLTSAILTIRW